MQTAKDDTEPKDRIEMIGWVLDSPDTGPEVPEFTSREEWAVAVAVAEAEFRASYRAKFGAPQEPPVYPAPSRVRVLPASPWGWTNLVR